MCYRQYTRKPIGTIRSELQYYQHKIYQHFVQVIIHIIQVMQSTKAVSKHFLKIKAVIMKNKTLHKHPNSQTTTQSICCLP